MIAEIVVGLLVAILIPMYFATKHPWTLYAAPVGVALAVYNADSNAYFARMSGSVGAFGAAGIQALVFGVALYAVDTVNNVVLMRSQKSMTPLQMVEQGAEEVGAAVKKEVGDIENDFNKNQSMMYHY